MGGSNPFANYVLMLWKIALFNTLLASLMMMISQAFLTNYQISIQSPHENHFQMVNMKHFHILRKLRKPRRISHKEKTRGSLLLGFSTINLIFFRKYFLLLSHSCPSPSIGACWRPWPFLEQSQIHFFDNWQEVEYIQRINHVKYIILEPNTITCFE